MEIQLRVRQKIKAKDVPVGKCLREIQRARALLVIDLTQVDMFRQPEDSTSLVLRDDVVYVVDIGTGIIEIIPRDQEVYCLTMKAEEVD